MSRIGRMPVELPDGVEIKVEGRHVKVRGPRGELTRSFHPDMRIAVAGKSVKVSGEMKGDAITVASVEAAK